MDIKGERYRKLSRRAMILGGAQALGLLTLVGRMVHLQIVNADQYKLLAEENRVDLRLISPLRGRILDRHGMEIANNQLNYRVSVIPEQAGDFEATLRQLAGIIPLPPQKIEAVMRLAARSRRFLPVTVSDNLTWEEFALVNGIAPELPGVQPDAGRSRFYPYPAEFAHLSGYVGQITDKELARLPDDPLYMLPEFRIGKRGLERHHDKVLRGVPGLRRVEVNALGREVRELTRDDGKAGQDLVTTIDADLQRFAMQRLADQSAAVVVMNVHSGEVVTLASAPAFDPNDFNFGIRTDVWKALLADERKPLMNKTVQGQYPPGSTFKPVVAMAALEAGLINPQDTVFCPGSMRFGGRTFHCWKRGGHGSVNMVSAQEQSCDVYFYELARRMDVDTIARMARSFGLGERLGIEIDDEQEGLVPTRAWKRTRKRDRKWHDGETLSVSIGQGYMLATPLQLAVMTARIANGGYAVTPTLLRSNARPGRAADNFPPVGVTPEVLKVAQDGMIAVTEGGRGTAGRSRIRDWPRGLAGKTGTSQVRAISAAMRAGGVPKNESRPWEERDHALFVAWGPIDDPAYAISIIVEHGGGGSAVAAPIARDIMREAFIRDPCGLTGGRPMLAEAALHELRTDGHGQHGHGDHGHGEDDHG
ncbi:penicillin-binding protein 2 [Emcibacter sp. SYSU 3D8]|uniref:penicillin-binding protein 2 n=1 Tax=Emcibacter sp. SYSU 3D8 TaxID=3133969 RepID=UPI0031FE7566